MTDNRSDPEVGVSQYERFINVDQVEMLFGTFSSHIRKLFGENAATAGFRISGIEPKSSWARLRSTSAGAALGGLSEIARISPQPI